MTNVKGIAASSGYAIAKAYKLDMPDLTVTRTTVEDTEAEIALYNKSVAAVKLEIAAIKEAATKNLSEEEAAVFDAHAQILEDPELHDRLAAGIKEVQNRRQNDDQQQRLEALEDDGQVDLRDPDHRTQKRRHQQI